MHAHWRPLALGSVSAGGNNQLPFFPEPCPCGCGRTHGGWARRAFESNRPGAGREVELLPRPSQARGTGKAGVPAGAGFPAVEQHSGWARVKAGLAAGSHPCPRSSCSEAGGPRVQSATGRARGQGGHPVLPGGRGLPTAALQLVPQ